MAWSRTVMTYPPQVRQFYVALMETGHETTHTFETATEANYFVRMVSALRFAFMHDKNSEEKYRHEAANYTAELQDDGLTVKLLSTANTKRAIFGAKILADQQKQFRDAGINLPGEEQ
jgi:hypothetical protein